MQITRGLLDTINSDVNLGSLKMAVSVLEGIINSKERCLEIILLLILKTKVKPLECCYILVMFPVIDMVLKDDMSCCK